MNKHKLTVEEIDSMINQLSTLRKELLTKKQHKYGTWFIHVSGRYYQFYEVEDTNVVLNRYGRWSCIRLSDFKDEYRLAKDWEVKQHLQFIKQNGKICLSYLQCNLIPSDLTKVTNEPSINPLKCEFYMVTCRGVMGAKVRHADYKTAEEEAIRLAKKENHETWIVGVVASVKPTQVVTTEIKKKF